MSSLRWLISPSRAVSMDWKAPASSKKLTWIVSP
jgi:hypothetical protein